MSAIKAAHFATPGAWEHWLRRRPLVLHGADVSDREPHLDSPRFESGALRRYRAKREEARERIIDAARTEAGGWTRARLGGWGVSWPPPKGWRQKLISGNVDLTTAGPGVASGPD